MFAPLVRAVCLRKCFAARRLFNGLRLSGFTILLLCVEAEFSVNSVIAAYTASEDGLQAIFMVHCGGFVPRRS